MISGVPEQVEGTVVERRQHDEKVILQIAESLDISHIEVDEITRVGRINPNKPRLLRFKCLSKESRLQMLQRSRDLSKKPEFKDVFINPDLTRKQQEEGKRLREELRRRRLAGEQVIIRRGKVVQRDSDNGKFPGLGFRQ